MRRLPLSFRKRLAKRWRCKVDHVPRTLDRLETKVGLFLLMHAASTDVETLRTEHEATLCAARRVSW